MFTFNIGGTPALKMIPLEDTQADTPYLSSSQTAVLVKDYNTDAYTVFDLNTGKMRIYDASCEGELLDDHPSCAVLYPSETVKVSIRLEIMGGGE